MKILKIILDVSQVLLMLGEMMKGSVKTGFNVVTDLPTFSKNIEKQSPLPQGCLF